MTEPQQTTTALMKTVAMPDGQSAQNPNDFREIPDYQTASDEIKAQMDQIISEVDIPDINAALAYGDAAQAERSRVAEQILDAHAADSMSFLVKPMEEALEGMKGFDFNGIQEKLGVMARKGTKFVGGNKLLLAGAGAAAFVSLPLALIGGSAALAAKGGIEKFKNRNKPQTRDDLDNEISQSIADFKPKVRELQAAQQQMPALSEKIENLGRANVDSMMKTTLYIGAGREIVRRLNADVLPQFQADGDANSIEQVNVFIEYLKKKLLVLEEAREASMKDAMLMTTLKKAVADNNIALQSILTSEIPNYQAQMSTSALSVSVMRSADLVRSFRERGEQSENRAVKAAETARQLAAANQIDSPERLLARAQSMQNISDMLQRGIKALESVSADRVSAQRQLAAATDKAIGSQIGLAQATLKADNLKPSRTLGSGDGSSRGSTATTFRLVANTTPVPEANTMEIQDAEFSETAANNNAPPVAAAPPKAKRAAPTQG